MTTIDLSDLSHGYPFLHLARKTGVKYEFILECAEIIDAHPEMLRPVESGPHPLASVIWDVCHAPWRWDMSRVGEVGL